MKSKNLKHMGSIIEVTYEGKSVMVDYSTKFVYVDGTCSWESDYINPVLDEYDTQLSIELRKNLIIKGLIPLKSDLSVEEILLRRGIKLKDYTSHIINMGDPVDRYSDEGYYLDDYLEGFCPLDRGYLTVWSEDSRYDTWLDVPNTYVHPYIY